MTENIQLLPKRIAKQKFNAIPIERERRIQKDAISGYRE